MILGAVWDLGRELGRSFVRGFRVGLSGAPLASVVPEPPLTGEPVEVMLEPTHHPDAATRLLRAVAEHPGDCPVTVVCGEGRFLLDRGVSGNAPCLLAIMHAVNGSRQTT